VQQALDRLRRAEDDMRRAVDEHRVADARNAVDQLREATKALGGLQQQDASRQVDSLAQEAARLANQQREQAQRLRGILGERIAQQGGAGRLRTRDGGKAVEAFINDRQRLADDLAHLTQEVHTAERAASGRSHDAASKLRGALSDLEQADTETQLQRSADVLRRGYGPITDAGETEISSEMEHLRVQLGEAQQAMSRGQPSSEGALGEVERLRSRLANLDKSLRGSGEAGGPVAGPVTGGARAGDGGFINGGWNAGNNSELPRRGAPDAAVRRGDAPGTEGSGADTPLAEARSADSAPIYAEGMRDLDRLRRSVGDDPEARRQVDELIRSMQRLDPKRFPGNPAMIDELYARVVSGVDKLELQLRHVPDEGEPAEVRSDNTSPMPSGYQAAVAEYFRRLSRNP
jgi:FtsZ-binding cell division protein ZapB